MKAKLIYENIKFKKVSDPRRVLGVGIEGAIKQIKEQAHVTSGPDGWSFDSVEFCEILRRNNPLKKAALKEILEEFLSDKKKYREPYRTGYGINSVLEKVGLLFDPKYKWIDSSNVEMIFRRFPDKTLDYILNYFTPNQLYSAGIKMKNYKIMREAINRGATNLSIGGEIPYLSAFYANDPEMIKILLDSTPLEKEDLFGPGRYWGNERDESNKTLRYAARAGNWEIFKLLFDDPRSNPSATNNFALKWATLNNHWKIVDELLKDKRVRNKISLLPKKVKNILMGFKYI